MLFNERRVNASSFFWRSRCLALLRTRPGANLPLFQRGRLEQKTPGSSPGVLFSALDPRFRGDERSRGSLGALPFPIGERTLAVRRAMGERGQVTLGCYPYPGALSRATLSSKGEGIESAGAPSSSIVTS